MIHILPSMLIICNLMEVNFCPAALLKQHGLRSVEEGEIGLSILYMSTEGLCNASFKPSDIFKRSSSASQPSEVKM